MRQESELRVNSIQTKETSVNSRDKKFESNNKIIVDMAKQSDFIIDMVDQDFFDRKKAKTPLQRSNPVSNSFKAKKNEAEKVI